jgi:hypothetical protein
MNMSPIKRIAVFFSSLYLISGTAQAGVFEDSLKSCDDQSANYCNNAWNPASLTKSWYEFEFQFIRRQTEVQNQNGQCRLENHRSCLEIAKKAADKAQQLQDSEKKQIAEMEAETQKRLAQNQQVIQKEQSVSDAAIYGNAVGELGEKLAHNVKLGVIELCRESMDRIQPFVDKTIADYNGLKAAGLSPANLLLGKGVGLGISAQAGLGASEDIETIINGTTKNSCLGAYCVHGHKAQAAASAGAQASAIQAFQCKNGNAYRGAFLTVSGEMPLGPEASVVTGSVGYSLGLDIHGFLNSLNGVLENTSAPAKAGKVDLKALKNDVAAISTGFSIYLATSAASDEGKLAYSAFIIALNQVSPVKPGTLSAAITEMLRNPIMKNMANMVSVQSEMNLEAMPSIGMIVKKELAGMATQFPAGSSVAKLFQASSKLFTSCDSLSIGASVGPSVAAPVVGNASIKLSEYTLMGELPMRDLEDVVEFLSSDKEGMQAIACAQYQNGSFADFKAKLDNVKGRLQDMAANFRGCLSSSADGMVSYEMRIADLAKGETYAQWPATDYDSHYSINHPHSKNCECGNYENPDCAKFR